MTYGLQGEGLVWLTGAVVGYVVLRYGGFHCCTGVLRYGGWTGWECVVSLR